jgi:hypothetical protein
MGQTITCASVMAGFVPAIHDFDLLIRLRRGCPRRCAGMTENRRHPALIQPKWIG